jgi:hypothetical protein
MVFQGTLLVGCLELGVGRRWINTQGVVVFGVFDHCCLGMFLSVLNLRTKSGRVRRKRKREKDLVGNFVDVDEVLGLRGS